jgi:hypothetical protein
MDTTRILSLLIISKRWHIKVDYVSTGKQCADILTKFLANIETAEMQHLLYTQAKSRLEGRMLLQP